MKRRGPPNKHAEAARAAKQQRLEPNISPGPHNAAEALISIAGAPDPQQVLDAESIAPWPVLTLLIDDFFTYIHPLAPFPHEPTFRMSFTARQDRTNRGFLALLASMIGCLVASFPRTARLHLKTQPHGMHMYPKALTLIDRCRTVALEARGSAFYSRDDVSVYDAATSYFLGLAAAYTMQWKVSRRFVAESMTFIRELGYHKPRDMGSSMFGVTYRGPSFNHVEDQLGKRIFWTLFVSLRYVSSWSRAASFNLPHADRLPGLFISWVLIRATSCFRHRPQPSRTPSFRLRWTISTSCRTRSSASRRACSPFSQASTRASKFT